MTDPASPSPTTEAAAPPASPASPAPATPSSGPSRLRGALAPIGVGLLLLIKFAGKLKFLILPIVKFAGPVLKTGGTMILSIGLYAIAWGWKYALGFVLLIFVHETGHLVAARRIGLKVGAPVFIPFMGAFIALKEAPRDAWIEAQVGIGGPILGALGALACHAGYVVTGEPLLAALAYTGYFLNLFNLAPVGFLDGGRIVAALSPWLWLLGAVVLAGMLVVRPSFIIVLILLMSLPRLFSLFRQRTETERRYYEVAPRQRLLIGGMYFSLIALLAVGMSVTNVAAPGRQADPAVIAR